MSAEPARARATRPSPSARRRLTVRGVAAGVLGVQTVILAAILVPGVFYGLPGAPRLPQAITAVALALGLLAVMPIHTRAPGAATVIGWLARTRLVDRWIDGVRPFQFAALSVAAGVVCAERLPVWLPALAADVAADWAKRGAGETIAVWTVMTVVLGGGIALVVVFGGLMIAEALGFVPAAVDRKSAATEVLLWNVAATGLAVAVEAVDLLTGPIRDPSDWRWWVNLAFALAIARSVTTGVVLFGSDLLGGSLDAVLAGRARAVRITRGLTAAGLVAAGIATLGLEPRLGVWCTLAAVAALSHPVAVGLERVSARAVRARG